MIVMSHHLSWGCLVDDPTMMPIHRSIVMPCYYSWWSDKHFQKYWKTTYTRLLPGFWYFNKLRREILNVWQNYFKKYLNSTSPCIETALPPALREIQQSWLWNLDSEILLIRIICCKLSLDVQLSLYASVISRYWAKYILVRPSIFIRSILIIRVWKLTNITSRYLTYTIQRI